MAMQKWSVSSMTFPVSLYSLGDLSLKLITQDNLPSQKHMEEVTDPQLCEFSSRVLYN